MKFPIANIVVKDRKRELGDVTTLAKSIQEIGLLNPITIQPNGDLIAGYHRLSACQSLGWFEVEVNMVDLEALDAELAEIDENLIRNELHWLDRDKQLARRKEIYEIKHPETKPGAKGGWHNNKTEKLEKPIIGFSSLPSFVQDTASKAKLGATTVKESIQRAKAFTEEQGEVLKKADVKSTDATRLARLEEPQRAAVIETLATGKTKSFREAKAIVKQEERVEALDNAHVVLDHYHVYHCSVADFSNHVEPESIDAIITDPPYPKEFLPVYHDLAQFAAYALKPGGSLIAMTGQSYLPEIMHMFSEHLTYHWTLCYRHPGPETRVWQRQVISGWKPLLWFTKGQSNIWIKDDIVKSREADKEHHEWGQSESGMANIIEQFTKPEQTICDPFVGGGTTAVIAAQFKCHFIGCDIDETCVQKTLQRVREVFLATV